jgi:RimJ/RimL family protein N-acetyltransferase
LPSFVRWFNDPEVRYWLTISDSPDLTMEKEWEWFEGLRADTARVVWCIEAEGKPVGTLGLHEIDETHGRATLGIAIGEKEYWGRGYGREAIGRALAYGFGELELRRIDLNVDQDNERGIRCYEACGFQREGLLRAYRLRRGRPVSGVVMSVLREEFEGQR